MTCEHGTAADKFCPNCEFVSETIDKMVALSMKSYQTSGERGALRCALGDAAALCDKLATVAEQRNRTRRGAGPTNKHGRELSAIIKRCGDAIWAMREKITTGPS